MARKHLEKKEKESLFKMQTHCKRLLVTEDEVAEKAGRVGFAKTAFNGVKQTMHSIRSWVVDILSIHLLSNNELMKHLEYEKVCIFAYVNNFCITPPHSPSETSSTIATPYPT